jgi:hypothetical protein
MPDHPTPSGADLARQALAAYKAGRRPGSGPTSPKPTRRTRRSGDGRDPQAFAAVLERLGAEQGWTGGVRGGNILDRFAELCPQYDGRVQAVAYDADRGRLDLRPGSDAYAAQLRLLGGQLCRQINDKLGTDAVRSIRVLPVASLDTRRTPPSATAATEAPAAGRPRTRETASAGYHQALAVHREHRREEPRTDFAARVAEAAARQTAALLARRPPAEEHAEYLAQLEAQQAREPADALEASLRAALRYKRTGQTTGGGREPMQVFGAA